MRRWERLVCARHRSTAFDIGGVLIDWHPDRVHAELSPDPVERQRFFAEVCSPEWTTAWDAGGPLDEACKDAIAVTGSAGS